MASSATSRPAPIGVRKRISIREFFSNTKRKKIGITVMVLLAAIGAYLLFFVGAAPNNCSPVEGGGICDLNQAINPAGTDSTFSVDAEIQSKMDNEGWKPELAQSVPFRIPNFPQNGAMPLWRFRHPDANISAHYLVLEGTAEFNTRLTDGSVKEGIVGYAWPDGRQPGTTPIHRAVRGGWYIYTIYTDNQSILNLFLAASDKTWADGGVNFWAYPSNYFPPQPAAVPTKDSDCANQNLTLGDKGSCVQTLKGILNGYVTKISSTSEQLDLNNNTFDVKTKEYTAVYITYLKSIIPQTSDFNGVVTTANWQSLESNLPSAGRAPTGTSNADAITPCPQGGGNTETGLKEYIDGVAAGKKYDTACHTYWLTFAKSKSTPAPSNNASTPKTTTASQEPATRPAPQQPVVTPATTPTPTVKCPTTLTNWDKAAKNSQLTSECIEQLQRYLISLGLLDDKITGVWTPNTAAALATAITNESFGRSMERECNNRKSIYNQLKNMHEDLASKYWSLTNYANSNAYISTNSGVANALKRISADYTSSADGLIFARNMLNKSVESCTSATTYTLIDLARNRLYTFGLTTADLAAAIENAVQ